MLSIGTFDVLHTGSSPRPAMVLEGSSDRLLVEVTSTQLDDERRGSVDSDDVATRLDPSQVPDNLSAWSLMPGSPLRRIWDYVLIISVFYSITVVPFQFAFLPPYPVPIDNVVVDTIFILDVVIQSIVYHSNSSGDVITPHWRSFVYYLKGWFLVDVISSIPYSYIALTSHLTVSNGSIFVPINILRLTRFVKVLKAFRLSNKYAMAAFSTRVHPGLERLLRLLFLVFLVGHLSACLWYFIGRVYDDNPHSWINRNEIYFDLNSADALDLYILCLYFAFTTLATVGYGDITPRTRPEIVFAMMLFILGVAVFSYAMANVTSLLYEVDREARFFRNRMGALLSFCRTANVSAQVQQQVLKQMSREWRRAPLSEDWESIRNDLPTDVRSMLMWHIYSATFRASRTFSLIEAQSGVVHRKLVGSVRPFRAVRGQVIAKEGETCKGIYLTSSGSVEQIVNRVMIGLYSQGYSFGEIPMFLQKNQCWPCTFRCRTSALFLYISQADLFAALMDADQIQDVFTQRARSKLQRLRDACGVRFPRGNDPLQPSSNEIDMSMILANIRTELDKVQEMASVSPVASRMLRRSSSEHILRRQLSI